LHTEELHDLYFSPDITRTMRLASHGAHMRGGNRCLQDLGGKTWRKRPIERSKYRWKDSIKTDLKEIRCDSMDWIYLFGSRGQWRALV